nr:hypothetical protein [Polymorphobacter megasporae]
MISDISELDRTVSDHSCASAMFHLFGYRLIPRIRNLKLRRCS